MTKVVIYSLYKLAHKTEEHTVIMIKIKLGKYWSK